MGKQSRTGETSSSLRKERNGPLGALLGQRPRQQDLVQFTRQFSTLLNAGVPVVRAISTMTETLRPGAFCDALDKVRQEVESGSSLSEAMARSPQMFDPLFISMVRAGEAGGFLGRIFRRLSDFLAKSQRLRKQIIGAMVYPAAVIGTAILIVIAIMIFVIPKIVAIFESEGLTLPWLTRMVIAVSDMLLAYWYVLPFIPLLAIAAWCITRAFPQGRYATDLALLYLPVFGSLLRKTSVSRFCRTLGELGAAGVPLLDSLTILRNAAGNEVVALAITDIRAAIQEGEGFADPMRRSGVFGPMVVSMVSVGEETGELDRVLQTIADDYDEEIDQMIASLMSLLEPFLIIGMGLVIGTIVIALFIPIIEFIMQSM